MAIWVDVELCDVCGKCVKTCPYDVIEFKNGQIEITEKCTECGSCVESCKNQAIHTDVVPISIPDFSKYKNVWVFIEQELDGSNIKTVSLELLSKARELAKILKEKVIAILLGSKTSNCINKLKNSKVDQIIAVKSEILAHYDSESYAKTIEKIVTNERPNIFLFGSTYLGRDLAPRVAKLLNSGLTADCTNLKIDEKEKILVQTRPAFSGNLLATIVNRFSRPQMATVRPGVIPLNGHKERFKNVEVKNYQCTITHTATKLLETVKEKEQLPKLGKAKIIIAGGRGMKNSSGFDLLHRVAFIFGGIVAGTRVAVENGWISERNQVGQTGQNVRPNIYIACGISGAVQHRAGMANSKFIIAVNNDPQAAIFKIADLGIVGNALDILPKLVDRVQSLLSTNKSFSKKHAWHKEFKNVY